MTFYTLVHSGRILPIVETRLPNQHILRQYKHEVNTIFSMSQPIFWYFVVKVENYKDDDDDGDISNKAAL